MQCQQKPLAIHAHGHKIPTHAERKLHLPVKSPIQGKVRVIAALQSASRVRRTPESSAKTQGKSTKPATGASSALASQLRQVTAVLEDYKAQDIVVIPLAGQATFADYLVIATGTSSRHVSSMGSALQAKLGKKEFLGLEGMTDGEWVCADLGNIVIHIFVPEKRVLYNLEKLWSYAFPEPEDSAK